MNALPKLLLHVCCAPDEIVGIVRLKNQWDITCYFYNPNIFPQAEYNLRKNEAERIATTLNVPFLEGPYDFETFDNCAQGLHNEPERGKRCEKCIQLRLLKTAQFAFENGFGTFGTVLSVSPHKSIATIRQKSTQASNLWHVHYLDTDLKKKNGFLQSLALCKEYAIYRQNYCGCRMSMAAKNSNTITPQ